MTKTCSLLVSLLLCGSLFAGGQIYNPTDLSGVESDISAVEADVTALEAADVVHDTRLDSVEQNLILTWVEQQINDSLTRVPLVDGYRDFFEDQSGIDLTLSSNQTFSVGYYEWSVPQSTEIPGAQYKLNDDAATTVIIDSVGTNTGTATANTDTTAVPGKYNSAWTNAATYIFVPRWLDLTNTWTIMLWAKPSSVSGNQAMLGCGAYFRIALDSSTFRVDDGLGATDSTKTDVAANTIYHFAVTLSGGVFSFFVNGSPAGSGTPVDISGANAKASISIGAGNWEASPTAPFAGWIDDVRIFDRALTPAEILVIYASSSEDADVRSGGNMALVSATGDVTTLDFDPDAGRLGVWIEETTDTLVPNTDAKGYLSQDAGTNWVYAPFDSTVPYSTNAGQYVWFSGVTNFTGTGSNLLWKFESCNTAKTGRIRGAFPQAR